MKKRLLLPLSLLCLAGMIVACGQTGTSSNQQSEPSAPSSSIDSEPPVISSSTEPVGPDSSSSAVTPPPSSSETPVNYQVSITNLDSLKEEWFASDGNKTIALSCSPGVVRTLLGKEIFVASSDESIVKVENNQVLVPVAPGKVTITVIYHNAFASCQVTVKGMTRPATIEEVAKGVADGTITSSSKAIELYGTVTGIYGNTSIIQEGDYAMYVYNKNYEGIKVGDKAHLISTYTLYNGLVETSAVTIYEKSTKAAEEIKAVDVTAEEFAALGKQDASRLINVKNIYSLGESLSKSGCAAQASSSAYRVSSVKIGDLETYIFVNKYLPQADMDAINAKLNQAEADSMKIEVKGGHVYTNTSYMDKMAISITSADQLTLTESDIVTLPTKVELTGAKDTIEVEDGLKLTPKFTPANTNRKALEYTSSNENVAKVDGGLVVGVGVGEATITATSTAEGCENVKGTFNVKVSKVPYVTNPEDGKEYYFGLSQQNLEKKIYLNGEMDGYYFKTVDNIANAVLVKVEKKSDENKYALKAGAKYLKIEVGGAYVNTVLSDEPFYFEWDTGLYAFFDNVTTCTNAKKNGKCYLGTSGTYTTVSAANNQKFFAHLYPQPSVDPEVPAVEYVSVGSLSYNKDATVVINDQLSEATDPKITYTSTSGVGIVVRKNTSSSNVNVWKADYSSCRWYVGHKVSLSSENAFNRIVFTCDSGYETFKDEDAGSTIKELKAAGITVTFDADAKTITLDLPEAVKNFDLVPDKQIRPSNVELFAAKAGPKVYSAIGTLSYNKDATVVINDQLSEATDPKITYTSTSGVEIVVRKNTASSNVNVWKADYASCRWYVGHKVTFSSETAFERIVLTCDSGYETFKDEDAGSTIKDLKAAGIEVTFDADAKTITLDLPAPVKTFDLVPDKQIRPSNVELFKSDAGGAQPEGPKEYVTKGSLSYNKDATVVIEDKLSDATDAKITYTSTSGVAIVVRKNTSSSNVNVWKADYSSCRWYVGHKVTISSENEFDKIVFTCDSGYEVFKDEDAGSTIKDLKAAGIEVVYDADAKTITLVLPAPVKSFDLVPDKQIRPSNVEIFKGESSGGNQPAGPKEYEEKASLSYNKDATVVINDQLSEATDPKITYTSTSGVAIVVRKNTSSSNVNVWKADYSSCRWYVGHKVTISSEVAFDKIVLTCDSGYEVFKDEDAGSTIKDLKAAGIEVVYDADAKTITLLLPSAVKSFDLVPDKQIRPSNVQLFASK